MSSIRAASINGELDEEFNLTSSNLTDTINELRTELESLEAEKYYLVEIIKDILEAEETGFLEDALTRARETVKENNLDD